MFHSKATVLIQSLRTYTLNLSKEQGNIKDRTSSILLTMPRVPPQSNSQTEDTTKKIKKKPGPKQSVTKRNTSMPIVGIYQRLVLS